MIISKFVQKRELELAISEDDVDDEVFLDKVDGLNMNDMITPSPGGPFSALTSSMWPQDIMAKLTVIPDDPNSQPEYRFDEFGFRVEEEDGPEQSSNKLLGNYLSKVTYKYNTYSLQPVM